MAEGLPMQTLGSPGWEEERMSLVPLPSLVGNVLPQYQKKEQKKTMYEREDIHQ